ncbi:hypothetical protein L6452_15177 [Arctium lappa]|uniref:Uncharacterized protein n=1 Tax=Arctium lappa TaxID=4217 RepID=A0ACB9CN12_ARCLA|nr:hypothetical protein L6452_15177 [Arctium lappa]
MFNLLVCTYHKYYMGIQMEIKIKRLLCHGNMRLMLDIGKVFEQLLILLTGNVVNLCRRKIPLQQQPRKLSESKIYKHKQATLHTL